MKRKHSGFWRRLVVSVLFFALLLSGILALVNGMSGVSDSEQLALVENTVRNALVTCYAVEGAYPSSLSYLKEHYAVAYDEATVYVRYDFFASNVMPQIKVMRRGDGRQ